MTRLIKKYQGKAVEDAGCYMSKEAKSFVSMFRNALKREFIDTSVEVVSCKAGHYFLYGFLQNGDKYVYFSYDIPRYGKPIDSFADGLDGVLYRTAESTNDFHGGTNHYTSMVELKASVISLLK